VPEGWLVQLSADLEISSPALQGWPESPGHDLSLGSSPQAREADLRRSRTLDEEDHQGLPLYVYAMRDL
jgi:hypothetical protein